MKVWLQYSSGTAFFYRTTFFMMTAVELYHVRIDMLELLVFKERWPLFCSKLVFPRVQMEQDSHAYGNCT